MSEEVNEISIKDFSKIELRTAVITSVAPHPNADRLYVIKANLGDLGERQLVAGIREHYNAEELVGRSIVVVANLQPVTIRGEDSRGMLLAAKDSEGRLTLITPEREVSLGSLIS